MDGGTAIGTGLAVIGSKDLLIKMLGPTADYVGGEVKNLVQKCNINLDRIFIRAKDKLGTRIDEPGQVSARVLKDVLDEGRFVEDELVADYYGGVLASSKSGVNRDDRAVAILAVVKAMSVYQIRLHYTFYRLVAQLHREFGKRMERERTSKPGLGVYLPETLLQEAMDFTPEENVYSILAHCAHGLARAGLIEEDYAYGSKQDVWARWGGAHEGGIVMFPTMFGAEVFLWASGVHGATGHELLEPSVELPAPVGINIPEGAQKVP